MGPRVLGIETSCDETAAAVVVGRRVLSSVVASQIDLHQRFGGVVPEVAAREHVLSINSVLDQAMTQAGTDWADLDAIAVTLGPGLVGALLTGVTAAKTLSLLHGKPLVGVHHLEGHLYSTFLAEPDLEPPFVCLLVSGGHTSVVRVDDHGVYKTLGQTRDDAVGEAFDKVARLMALGYPGGPAIQQLAAQGDPHRYILPRGTVENRFDTSFSGLKTAVARLLQKDPQLDRADLAASFEWTVAEILAQRVQAALEHTGLTTLVVAGGVSANRRLRERFAQLAQTRSWRFIFPPLSLCTDNAAMIACAGAERWRRGQVSGLNAQIFSRCSLDNYDLTT
ncbi:tRNA (adenosine(37)-N6)-threonylcarbamoyltransferase complex transferase subunit TsaD [Candidatus Cyanaurora vandensis]|uniref:tRNA (adenosine(37)-N6)-threonylcarbamoyltransferase complex transferase subunit TsaD n=1 Tax=Candidatus Cyanaurora vandensis TaxID=2714958 RepID=UPI0025810096|nr:tRNA (adenosine(37)-N6)-threonylcarbamoyltransferase complex transferase subunit TsaD [Candidatus Cyanaurora vandensis]